MPIDIGSSISIQYYSFLKFFFQDSIKITSHNGNIPSSLQHGHRFLYIVFEGYLLTLSPSETVEKNTLSLQEYFLPASLSVAFSSSVTHCLNASFCPLIVVLLIAKHKIRPKRALSLLSLYTLLANVFCFHFSSWS